VESPASLLEDNLALKKGDRVFVRKREYRTDDEETYTKMVGEIIEAFNAWDPKDGDHWQYKIKGDKGQYWSFYEGSDQGTIELILPKS
jgi:signal peptidase I